MVYCSFYVFIFSEKDGADLNCVNFLFSSEQELDDLIISEKLSADDDYLIRIHTCIHTEDNIMTFVNMIQKHFPKAKIIGSSTSGVIYAGGIHTDCCLVSVTRLHFSEVKTCLVRLSGKDGADLRGTVVADKVIDSLISDESLFMLTFVSRPYLKINSFVERFNERAESVNIIGGFANTPQNPEFSVHYDAFVFDNNGVSSDSLAAAVIDSKQLMVYSDLIYVTEPVGITHTITDADDMIIRAIDGENAVEWYQKQLGIDLAEKMDFDITSLFPLVRSDYGETPWAVAYSPQNENTNLFPDEPDPVLFVPSKAKAGEKVRISYSSIQKSVEVCENVCKNLSSRPAEVLFGYTCVSRQFLFSNCAKWELMPFAKTNLSGALVAGEIGNIKNVNRYCNYSSAIAALAESNRRTRIDTEALRRNFGKLVNKQEHIVKYLIEANKFAETDEGLALRQQEIEESLFKDADLGISNITKYSFDFSMGKFDKICMLSFRNEGLLNAFMSRSKFNSYFIRFYKAIIEFIDDENFTCYVYKKNSLIIVGSPSVRDNDFIDVMRAVQNFVSDYRFAEYISVSEFSIVMHEEDMINKAELTLVNMRAKNIFFLNYTSDLGLEQIHARNLKMMKILNDAVTYDRVVPFFQGIRDNSEGKINMYESLMRIKDDDGQIYNPAQFMDIAKEYGFYPDISYLMIIKIMEFFRDRNETVTINLNISDIYNYRIVHSVLKHLSESPHPENFIFELTETEEIQDYQIIAEFVEQIHLMGGKIAIDDFGSGFSNIVNIFKVKSDYIKIDGEIVRNIKNDIYARELLEMIVYWAEKHGKEIVAEYIENQDIQDIVKANGIRYSQGYLFSQPAEKP